MTTKFTIQVCFSLKNGLTTETIRTKLGALKKILDHQYGSGRYEVRSCHLNRAICLDKGLTTEIPDAFDEIFGKDYICELTETTFAEAVQNMDLHRTELSQKADRLVILAEDTISNVALELKLFTMNRVMVL